MKKGQESKFKPYYDAIGYLESLGNITGGYQKTNLKSHPRPAMFLERMQEFLDMLGNPEKGFKYIHITGTAGKGTVSSLVHSGLVKKGKRSGLFTSPFTVSTIEKIQVGKKYIDPLVLVSITEGMKPKIDRMILEGRHGGPSYFEMILAIALIYFKREKCEYAVLEVGLGGRYDATNVIEKPLVTAVTNIGLDHTNILGKTKAEIAFDKAGIIKKGSRFLTTEADPKILKIFKDECLKTSVAFHPLAVQGMSYMEKNVLLAGQILKSVGVFGEDDRLGKATQLPARFEYVEPSPSVILDGAHNPSKMESVISNLRDVKYRKLSIVLAVSGDKDWKAMIRMVAPYAQRIYVTRFSVPGRISVDPKLLYGEAIVQAKGNCQVELFSDPFEAFRRARAGLSKQDALLITGSFYLAGDIRSLYCPEETILKNRDSRLR